MSRSPYYDAGDADGTEDAVLASLCPPKRIVGKNPSKAWSVMYNRGYDAAFKPAPCVCDKSCKKGKGKGKGRGPDQSAGRKQTRAPLAFKPGRLAFKPGRMAFKPGSLAFNPKGRALSEKMQARAERIRQGNGQP